MFDSMAHHWRASDNLEHAFRAGEWRLYDRGVLVGTIEYGRINGKGGLRGLSPTGAVLGYAETLEEACDRLWDWHRASRPAPANEAQPATEVLPATEP